MREFVDFGVDSSFGTGCKVFIGLSLMWLRNSKEVSTVEVEGG